MMDTITVRQMPFEFPDEIDPVFIEGDPELSFEGMSTGYAMIASSLLLPHLEPYLIRSMTAAAKHVTDPKVLQSLEGFAAQEGQHYRMHMKFNAAIRRSGFPGLEALEQELSDDYHRFTKTRSCRCGSGISSKSSSIIPRPSTSTIMSVAATSIAWPSACGPSGTSRAGFDAWRPTC